MPSDTKLYLYLDPGRLISDAPYTWDNRQFAGWVPHQTVTYLWPSGPWYWLFEQLACPRLDRPPIVDRARCCSSAGSESVGPLGISGLPEQERSLPRSSTNCRHTSSPTCRAPR